MSRRPLSNTSPTFDAFSNNCSSRITSMVASAAAHETGFPPYVEPCVPIVHVIVSSFAIMAPSGMPLAMPLPASRMSGSTPVCSTAHILPVRPMPHCTSSQTRRMPCRSQSSRSAMSQPSGGTM